MSTPAMYLADSKGNRIPILAFKLQGDADISSIADSVRLKLNGSGKSFTAAQMREAVLSLSYANIPSFHYAEAGRVIKALLDFKTAHPHGLTFGIVTDNHVNLSEDRYRDETTRSIRHAAYALETVATVAGCDFVVNLGDNVWENGIDTETAFSDQLYFNDAIKAAFERQTAYRLLGNHDKSTDTQKAFDAVGKYNTFDAVGTTAIRGFGYKDHTAKKVRVICLNTTDYLNYTGGCALSYDQKDFLLRALDLSAKEDASEWQILLLSHIPLDYPSGDFNMTADLAAILSAYVNGTAVSIAVTPSYAINEDPTQYATYRDGALVYDYSGKNAARIIANVHGHMHTNCITQMENTHIWRVSVMNTCFSQNRADGGDAGYESFPEDVDALRKVAGTAADTSATFVCVDLSNQTVTVINYGAPVSHSFAYGAKTAYSVTYALTKCKSNNSVTVAVEGSEYKATLTPEDADGVLDGIVVTMGGVDITSEAVEGNTVRIDNVTGDVVITATASVPLWSQTVENTVVAPRSRWSYDANAGGFSFYNDNPSLAIGVSTPNDFGYTDRENNAIYVMPVPAKASTVKLNIMDGVDYRYSYILLNTVDGALVQTAESDWTAETSFAWTAGTAKYIAVFARRTDEASVPWGYDDTQVSVTFTNE